jgi:hypothetical protein
MHDDHDEFDEGDARMQREFNDKMMVIGERNNKACHALRYVECFGGEKMDDKERRVHEAALDVLLDYFKRD